MPPGFLRGHRQPFDLHGHALVKPEVSGPVALGVGCVQDSKEVSFFAWTGHKTNTKEWRKRDLVLFFGSEPRVGPQ